MSVESYIKCNIVKAGEKVYTAPDIPEKKLNNAVSAIAQNVDPNYVLGIIDSTVFGSAKEGIVMTGDTIYCRYLLEGRNEYKFEIIERAELDIITKEKDNGKIEESKNIYLHLTDKSMIEMPKNMFGVKHLELVELINGIIEEAGEDKKYTTTSQTLPLADMENDIKNTYIKIICNFAYSDDNVIDSKEYSEIISLIVRINYDGKDRLKLRSYMCDYSQIEETDDLIEYINNNALEGSLDIIKKSLMKDILYLYKLKNQIETWKNDNFIISLQNKFDIKDEHIELIIEAIKNDEEILLERKNDSEIIKSMKNLAAKAGSIGVPLAAIYFSGSVVGMSAAGITSGLAAIGMGGLLGFSGMVTGIGVVVLLGVGAYSGIKKLTGISDLENSKQRELMLQAIIKNSQKSLDYLIEDVNEISNLLMNEVKNGLETSKKIEKLSALLSMMSKGAKEITEKITYAEIESVISRLPKTLDIIRLEELTTEATKEKIREYILNCYIKREVMDKDGENKIIEYILDENISLNQLEQLNSAFDAIGYKNLKDATLATAKGAAKNLVKNVFSN